MKINLEQSDTAVGGESRQVSKTSETWRQMLKGSIWGTILAPKISVVSNSKVICMSLMKLKRNFVGVTIHKATTNSRLCNRECHLVAFAGTLYWYIILVHCCQVNRIELIWRLDTHTYMGTWSSNELYKLYGNRGGLVQYRLSIRNAS